MNPGKFNGSFRERKNIPHLVSRGKDRAVRDGKHASRQSSREHCPMNARIVE
jgi:hypothetical protein